MKRAFVVCGPESAGNRLLAAILAEAGCHGEGSTDAPYDDRLPRGESPVVILRSMPHGETWPRLDELFCRLSERGYDVTVLVTVREPVALARSQVAAGHQANVGTAERTNQIAYARIFAAIDARVRSLLVPYEAVVGRLAIPEFLELLGLEAVSVDEVIVDGEARPIEDANAKHYRAEVGA